VSIGTEISRAEQPPRREPQTILMGDTLLLLHGALYTSREFAPVVDELGQVRRVITVDFAGHGGERFPSEPFSIELFGRQILHRLDAEGVQTADIMGYSMGGYVALWLALVAPDRVGGVVTLGTKLRWDPETAAREVVMLDPEKIAAKVPHFASLLALRHGEARWKEVVLRTASMISTLGDRPSITLADAARINHRIRMMVGDRDEMVSIEETAEFYRALPAGQLAVLPSTPHSLEKTRPTDIARAISEVCLS